MSTIFSYILSFLGFYFAGLLSAWLVMCLIVILIVKNVFERDKGETIKQFLGSFAWGIIGYYIAAQIFYKIEARYPSFMFLLVCGGLNIGGSSVGKSNHKPIAQVLGAVVGLVITFLIYV